MASIGHKCRLLPITIVLFIVVFVTEVSCFSSGGVSFACRSRNPSHFPFSAQDSTGHFEIRAFAPNGNHHNRYNVQLSSTDGPFKGFLIQAYAADGRVVGRFDPPQPGGRSNHQLLSCSNHGDSVSHTDSDEKTSVTLSWSPGNYKGQVTFRATVVERYSKFWTDISASYTI